MAGERCAAQLAYEDAASYFEPALAALEVRRSQERAQMAPATIAPLRGRQLPYDCAGEYWEHGRLLLALGAR
jgi:hypothetical protein